jgi:hypothetical protein
VTEAARHNTGKPELSEIFWFDMEYLADHLAAGRAKYPDAEDGTPNFMLGGKPDKEYDDCIARHVKAIKRGEFIDPETGTPHYAAIAWNSMAALTLNHPYEGWERVDIGVRHGSEFSIAESEPEAIRVIFEGEPGDIRTANPGFWSFWADGGRRFQIATDIWDKAVEMGVASYETQPDPPSASV